MGLIDRIKPGHVGTAEFGEAFLALVQMANIAAKGGLKCVAVPATAGSSAAALNAATAGTYKRTVVLQIQDANNVVQKWFNGSATLTPTEAAVDAQIGVPVVTGGNTKTFVDGTCSVELTYDTDAGATKTYAVDDTVGFTTAVANVFGVAVTVSGATFLDTIVA
jgi:hypothetical protein